VDRDLGRGPARAHGRCTAVTAAQLRGAVERLVATGQWLPGDPDITIVADA
jgi:hypothetical protein